MRPWLPPGETHVTAALAPAAERDKAQHHRNGRHGPCHRCEQLPDAPALLVIPRHVQTMPDDPDACPSCIVCDSAARELSRSAEVAMAERWEDERWVQLAT